MAPTSTSSSHHSFFVDTSYKTTQRKINIAIARAREVLPYLNKKDQEDLINSLVDVLRARAREHFYTFTKMIISDVITEEFRDGRHIRLICARLQELEESIRNPKKKTLRDQYFLPPGSTKSRLCSILFPAWCLGRNPNWPIMIISNKTETAQQEFGKNIRVLVKMLMYRAIFPHVELRADSQAAGYWKTTKKGGVLCVGAGSDPAGLRAKLLIADDAVTVHTSEPELKEIKGRWGAAFQSRLLPGGAEIVINTRVRKDDLSGFLLENNAKQNRPWRVTSIPAILDYEGAQLLKLPEGTSYWPEYKPLQELLDIKNGGTYSPQAWASLYMQQPIPEEGTVLKADWIKEWKEEDPPELKYVLMALDTAYTEKKENDPSAMIVLGLFLKEQKDSRGKTRLIPNVILLDCEEFRLLFPELCEKVTILHSEFKPDGILIEKASSGIALLTEMERRGLPVIPFKVAGMKGDKRTRLNAVAPFFMGGRVWFPEGYAFSDLARQRLLDFPFGKHDDVADVFSQALLYLRDSNLLSHEGYSLEEDTDYEQEWEKPDYNNPNLGYGGSTYWDSV